MKRSLLSCLLVVFHLAMHAQVSRVERLSSVVILEHDYFSGFLTVYDSLKYEYPDIHTGGGLDQSFLTKDYQNIQAVALQYYLRTERQPLLPEQRFWITRNSPASITYSRKDYNLPSEYLEYLLDSIMEFNDKGQLTSIKVIYYPEKSTKVAKMIAYTYNEQSLLIADSTFEFGSTKVLTLFTEYTYDDRQRLIKKIQYSKTKNNVRAHVEYFYDEMNHLIRIDDYQSYSQIQQTTYFLFSADGSCDTVIKGDYKFVSKQLPDKNISLLYSKNTQNEWYLSKIKTDIKNDSGLVTISRSEVWSDTLMSNGSHWYEDSVLFMRYNQYGHLIDKEINLYNKFRGIFSTIFYFHYHWEPYMPLQNDKSIQLFCFPNPSNEVTHLNFNLLEKGLCELNILNLNGARILRKEVPGLKGMNEADLDLRVLPPGQYVIMVQQGKTIASSKLIKQ